MKLLTVGLFRALAAGILLALLLFFVLIGVHAAPGDLSLASLSTASVQGNQSSDNPSISSNGERIAFQSFANNLVAGDTNNVEDVFVRDRTGGTTVRVSVDSSGNQGDGVSANPAISGNGRYVAFYSRATNLVAGDTNGDSDVFVHDLTSGATTIESVTPLGVPGNSDSYDFTTPYVRPPLSDDGRYVAFVSSASDLVVGDTNFTSDVFLRDRTGGTTIRVSVDSLGAEGNGLSAEPAISGDGRYVAFASYATNLVPGDSNDAPDVFVYDRTGGSTTRVSVDSSGTQGDENSFLPAISANGRYVAFLSDATNLVAGDTNAATDVFVHDRTTGETTRLSISSLGVQSNAYSYNPAISADGRYVAFFSRASNLVPSDTNGQDDVFIYDRETASTILVSITPGGTQGNAASDMPAITANGRLVAFSSIADNLISPDANGLFSDVFLRELPLLAIVRDDSGDTGPIEPVTIDVMANDTPSTGAAWVLTTQQIIDPPGNGVAAFNAANQLDYTPDPGFSGTDTLNYRVCDSIGACGIATVTIAVAAAPGPNGGGGGAASSGVLPSTGFAPGRLTRLPSQPAGKTYSSLGDLWLEIPGLGVKAPVVLVPFKDGKWDVSWLAGQAGYLERTAFPTWNGNSVLTAHSYDANGKAGPFVNLGNLAWSDKIVVHFMGQKSTYTVQSVRLSDPHDLSAFKHEERPWLTLLTCRGYDEQSNSYRWRLVVRSVLTSVAEE